MTLTLVFLLYTLTMIFVLMAWRQLAAISFVLALVASMLVYFHFATSHLDIAL